MSDFKRASQENVDELRRIYHDDFEGPPPYELASDLDRVSFETESGEQVVRYVDWLEAVVDTYGWELSNPEYHLHFLKTDRS